jgi:hypothetical protein
MSLLSPTREVDNEYGSGNPLPRAEYSREIELLKKSGVIKDSQGIEGHFIKLMDEVGLDPRSVLARVAIIMDSGESDGVKLAAAKMALQLHMHPAMVARAKDEKANAPAITFVINSPQVNMQNVLVPGGSANQTKESW